MRRLAFVLTIILLAGGSTVAVAQPGDDGDGPFFMERRPGMDRLNLNEQQKKQVEQMSIEMQKQLVGVRSKAQMARLELRQLVSADNLEKAAIEKKISEIAQIRTQGASIRLNHWFEVNKLLTPEQQKVWRERLKHPLKDRLRAMRDRFQFRDRGPGRDRMMLWREMGDEGRGPEIRKEIRREIREAPAPEKK